MTKNPRGGVRAGVNFLQIRAANPASVDAQQEFPGSDGGDRNRFEAHVIDGAIDRRAHGRGHRAREWISLLLF